MKIGQKIRIIRTQEIGTIIEIDEESIKVYVPKRGTFLYLKSNLELIDRVPKSDCMDNTQ
jgi:hypothetical protein